jgi:hypothetical protein
VAALSDGRQYIELSLGVQVRGRTDPIPQKTSFTSGSARSAQTRECGLSPLGSLVREVAIDEHASNFTAAILKNLGIIGSSSARRSRAQGERRRRRARTPSTR